jgi:hypothetical protein
MKARKKLDRWFSRASRGCLHQVSHSDQIVGSHSEGKRPSNAIPAPMPGLAEHSHRFQPAEDFLHALPLSLADQVPGVSERALVQSTPPVLVVLRHMRSCVALPALSDEIFRVVRLVCADRDSVLAGNLFDHLQGGFPLGGSRAVVT